MSIPLWWSRCSLHYGFPADLKAFTHITKSITTKTDVRFKRLFRDLKDCREMKILSTVLNHLQANRFQSNDDVLKQLFQ